MVSFFFLEDITMISFLVLHILLLSMLVIVPKYLRIRRQYFLILLDNYLEISGLNFIVSYAMLAYTEFNSVNEDPFLLKTVLTNYLIYYLLIFLL